MLGASQSKKKGKDEDDENKEDQGNMLTSTVANPPSFYQDHVDKWQAKFAKAVKDREAQKRAMGRTMEVSCLTRNTNIRVDDGTGKRGKRGKSTAPSQSIDATNGKPSLFNQVLKRRRSRASILAPTVLDFEYAGDSAAFEHLIGKRPDGLGYPDKGQLNFEMNLRNYKNTTEFNAARPFLFPTVRQFSPRRQWAERKKDTSLLNAEFKRKFNDKFAERNANELLHQFDSAGVNSSAQWQCGLRNLKRVAKDHGTRRASPSKDAKKNGDKK